MKQSSADVLRQARVVEEERAWQHQPGGTRRSEGAVAPYVGVFGQRSCRYEIMCSAKRRDQVEREEARPPPLCRQDGGYEGNEDYEDDAVQRLAPRDARDATLYGRHTDHW